MTPTCSIVIPCYNKQAYVAAAIDSALAQGNGCEVIVIDDGSTDGSVDVVSGYKDRIIWEAGPNKGGSAARNRGLALAQGRYIQFLDADDVLPEGKVATQIAVLDKADDGDIAFCPWSLFHDDGRIDPPSDRRYWRSYQTGLDLLIDMWTFGGFFPPHAWLAPRALIDAAGHWDEALTGDDDGEFFGRLLAHAGQAHFVPDTRVFYRDPPEGSVSRNTSLKSARSFWTAFEHVADVVLDRRGDRAAKRAVLSRVRKTAYAWREVPEIVDNAATVEARLRLCDLSPSLPKGARWMIGGLGIRRGLALRRMMKG